MEINSSFNAIERDGKYHTLHAIGIHEGDAYSGHYFSYIKDHKNKKWRKFNDSFVSEVDESEVFESSNGGFAYRAAFWVVYIDDEQLQKAMSNDIYN